MPIEPIKIAGLTEFQASLKAMDAGLPKALRVALNGAADIVLGAARPQVPKRTGRAAATLRARSTRDKVRVAEGSARAPYVPWLDFGGRVGRKKAIQRRFIKDGRYIYPAYYEHRDQLIAGLSAALTDVARQAGLDVT